MRALAIWVAWSWLWAGAALAEPPAVGELKPQDFAYGRRVELPASDRALFQVELPVDVYRSSRTPGLRDVMLFNARGTQVPHALRVSAVRNNDAPNPVRLPLFPLLATANANSPELSVDVERSADGQVLHITSRSAPAEPHASPQLTAAYLLDARALSRPVVAFAFELSEAPDNLVLPLSVEASADLIHWESVAVEGALLHLSHAGHAVERDRVEISATRAAFFRVRPAGQAAFPLRISGVTALPAANELPPKLERVDVLGQALAAQSGVYRFDLGGPVPVERIEVTLPEDNTVIAAELWSSPNAQGPYERIAQARFYRVSAAGKVLSGPAIELTRQSVRYYELRVDTTRAALGGARPGLATYHAPDQLLFLRRGEGPFTLAYGRHRVARQRFEADDLLALVPTPDGKLADVATATLQPMQVLGGLALLELPKPQPPYKTYGLWAVLLCGVALLALLAYRLVRAKP